MATSFADFDDQGLHGQVHLELAADGQAQPAGRLALGCLRADDGILGRSLPSRIASKVR